MTTKVLQVYGMVCYACTEILENAVKKTPGVIQAEVNYMMDTITLQYEEALTDLESICNAAMKAGYRLEETEDNEEGKKRGRRLRRERKKDLRREILLVFFCSLLLNSLKNFLPALATLFLASIVQAVVIKEFYKDAGNGIANRKGNMSLLIAIGTTSGYLYSICAILFTGKGGMLPCFETIAAIVTMVLIGRFIEFGTRTESAGSIRHLLRYQSEKANVLQDGEIISIKLAQVLPGMKILIRSGEKVPADSRILEGTLRLDESVITGEYLPVEKRAGESVIGATYAIKGSAICQVEKELEQNLFYHLIEDASSAMLGKKISVIRYVDRIMEYFVPAVFLTSVLTLFLWFGFWSPGNIQKAVQCSLSVLLVACPCAIGLAVPFSVIHTIGCAAAHGIFIREEGKLEQLGGMKQIAFDKTGTLTTGEISVCRFWCSQAEEKEIRGLLYEAEKYSAHPIAHAIVRFAEKQEKTSCKIKKFTEHEGGIEAGTLMGNLYIGKKEFVESCTGRILSDTGSEGKNCVYFSLNETEGFLELEDTVRADAGETIALLKELGLRVAVLSGDQKKNSESIAEKLGIEEVHGNLLPSDKEKLVERWQQSQGVIMVGDGMNDLPGLLKSQVGIALGCGCDVLKECGDLIIGSSQLKKIPALISLSRAMHKNIRQNLIWTFSYNIIGIIMAVSGILSPLPAGFAMSLSSIVVMWNAGRMKRTGNKILENS